MTNVSPDLIWEITRSNNAYLVKRRTGGGAQFSRDPLNLVNKHSRKQNGFVNDKAVGVQPGAKGGLSFTSKKTKNQNKPALGHHTIEWGSSKPSRKTYRGISTHTAKNNYRPDLRSESVARASAIRMSQRPVKETPEKKLRGGKAKKAAEAKAA